MSDFNQGLADICWLSSLVWWGWGWIRFGLLQAWDMPLAAKLAIMAINAALFMQAFMEWRHHIRVIEIKEYCFGIIDELERNGPR
jgi:hypothetical protein